jgi:hypothetical protein
MTLIPAAVLIGRARGLLKSGFEHADLEVAFKSEVDRTREERSFTSGREATMVERLLRMGTIVSGTSMAGCAAVAMILRFPGAVPWVNAAFSFMALTVFSGFGNLVMLQRRRDVDSEFWGKLWTGRLGRLMFGLGRLLGGPPSVATAMTHRPTELVIAMAAEQLFADLPKQTRKGLEDLPDVVSRLEADARRMRARLEELQDTAIDDLASGTTDERTGRLIAGLRAERENLQARLAETVAALETIRLSLLHLHAGKISAQSLTTDLSRAREIAAGVDRLMEGRKEVEILLRTPTSSPHSAAAPPLPASAPSYKKQTG